MSKTMLTTLIGGATLAAGITLAAPAAATDTAAFTEHVHALAFSDGNGSLINTGMKLCDALNSGVSLSMAQAITENTLTPKGYSISDADRFVAYVVSDLCR